METLAMVAIFFSPIFLVLFAIWREEKRKSPARIEYKSYFSGEWKDLTDYDRQEAWHLGDYFRNEKVPWYVRIFNRK